MKPDRSSSLVTTGLFSISRNPMYVGLALLLTGWALLLGTLLPWAGLPIFVLLITELQIRPEEAALERLFGAKYEGYRKSVPRWILLR